MTRLIFISALVALVSACSSMSGGSMVDSSGMSRTNIMGASGYIGSDNGPNSNYSGGP